MSGMAEDYLGVVKRIDTYKQTTNEHTNNDINTQHCQQRDNKCKSVSLV